MQFMVRMQKKNEGPLRSADDEFGLPRHIIDYIWKQKRILITFETEIFPAVARSLLVEITLCGKNIYIVYGKNIYIV